MENTSKSLLRSANDLTASAMAAGITNEAIVRDALECAEFIRYIIELVNTGHLDEALYHLRSMEGTENISAKNNPA